MKSLGRICDLGNREIPPASVRKSKIVAETAHSDPSVMPTEPRHLRSGDSSPGLLANVVWALLGIWLIVLLKI